MPDTVATDTPCSHCRQPASHSHGLPFHNGDLVSNDWPGEWASKPSCEACYDRHAAGLLATWDHLYLPLLGLMIEGEEYA